MEKRSVRQSWATEADDHVERTEKHPGTDEDSASSSHLNFLLKLIC